MIRFVIGYLLLFLPLPIIRFALSQNIAETAQGRHILFPALLPLAFLIVVGLWAWFRDRAALVMIGVAAFFAIVLATIIWPRLTFANTPYLPVKATLDITPKVTVEARYADEIALIGMSELDTSAAAAVPVMLIWRALHAPSIDYSYRLTLLDSAGGVVGIWQGQPVNGRYPTRAWDDGDVVYDTVWIPVFPSAAGAYTLTLEVFDDRGQSIANADDNAAILRLSDTVVFPSLSERAAAAQQLENIDTWGWLLTPRGDRRENTAAYRYRNTIAMVMSEPSLDKRPGLRDPTGRLYEPTEMISDNHGTIALFSVDWRWESGRYDLVRVNSSDQADLIQTDAISIANNRRLYEPPPISRLVEANFDDRFVLLGYNLPVARVNPGSRFPIRLFWQSLQTTNTSYTVFNHLLDVSQTQRGGQDRVPQGFYSTILWNPGEVIIDGYTVPVSADAPDGIYWLDVGLYPTGDISAAPLSLMQADERLDKNSVRLGPIKVGGQPAESILPAPPQQAIDFRFGDAITLDGFSITLSSDQQSMDLALYWTPITIPPIDYTVFIHIVNEAGTVVTQADGPPVSGLYPTSFWDAGEQIFDPRRISLTDLSTGRYTLRLGWYDAVSGQRLAVPDNADGFVVLTEFAVE